MARALYDATSGYYASGRASIGRKGDFFTNISVGPLFGTLLARQFAEMWERLGRPEPFTIVEQGAHAGDFANDVLTALRMTAPECFAACAYRIVEPSATLSQSQAGRLAEFAPRVEWHAELAALPTFTGVHFSNELIDAFPVHLVKWTGSRWVERHVGWQDEAFFFTDGELSNAALHQRLELAPPVPPGYETEINLAMFDWLEAVAARLTRGFILAIDYGFTRAEYFQPERTTGTLSAYSNHRREPDPLARPGEIDLTAHVEFSSLIEHAAARGLSLEGFTDQHHFIVGLSRLHFQDAAPVTAAAQKELRALQTLMHPALMGRAFRALCLGQDVPAGATLSGFSPLSPTSWGK